MEQSKTLANGETITIVFEEATSLFCVECWDAEDNSRWHRWYATEEKALAEYNRWN